MIKKLLHHRLRNNVDGTDTPYQPRFSNDSTCTSNIGTEGIDNQSFATAITVTFTPKYTNTGNGNTGLTSDNKYISTPDTSLGGGMPHFYLIDVYAVESTEGSLQLSFINILKSNTLNGTGDGPVLTGADCQMNTPYTINFYGYEKNTTPITYTRRKLDIMKNLNLSKNWKVNPFAIVITPYDINNFSGYPIAFVFDGVGNQVIFNQTEADLIQSYTPQTILSTTTTSEVPYPISGSGTSPIIDYTLQMGFLTPNFFSEPAYEVDTYLTNKNIIGLCNNPKYSVSFKIVTTTTDTTIAPCTFIFSMWGFSYSLNDYPECFRDKNGNLISFFQNQTNANYLISEDNSNYIFPSQDSTGNTIAKPSGSDLQKLANLNSNIQFIIVPSSIQKGGLYRMLGKKK